MLKRIVPLMLLVLACETESLGGYGTSQIHADILVSATGDGTSLLTVDLTDGEFLTYLQLTAGDSLTATAWGATRGLEEHSFLGEVSYSLQFQHDGDDSPIVISLQRANGASAPRSTVRLPAPMTISPLPKTTYSRAGEALRLVWTTTGSGSIGIDLSGNCIDPYTAQVDVASGGATIPVSGLQKRASSGPSDVVPDNCAVTATFTRDSYGSLDPAFAGGSIHATQSRTTTFQSAP
jgi:hypothetical protein